MNPITVAVTYGCLLHDIGKICCLPVKGKSHSALGHEFLRGIASFRDEKEVLSCARFHHAADLKGAGLETDDVAYIACFANNVATAVSKQPGANSKKTAGGLFPLASIFTHLNGEHPGLYVAPKYNDGRFVVPTPNVNISEADCQALSERLKKELSSTYLTEAWLNSLLSLLEGGTSTFPSDADASEATDVSLFDHLKVTAAVGACISEYLQEQNITDYQQALFAEEASFKEIKCFLLYSADFSGIQKFIYTVSSKKALRSLRSRSFFLELALEHYIDELLEQCGVSRANLLYSGGGHCYILLPNTENVIQKLAAWNEQFNKWLMEQFGTRLYLADGYTSCCANDLTDTPYNGLKTPYATMFQRVTFGVAKHKVQRYSAQQVRELNLSDADTSGRECRICGRVDRLTNSEDETSICSWCSVFEDLSDKIQCKDVIVVLRGAHKGTDFALPLLDSEVSFLFTDIFEARELLKSGNVVRFYTKNRFYPDLGCSTRLYVGDYALSNHMEDLAEASKGIRRLGVCRMDVDNLGQAFVAGFVQKNGDRKYVTISRTAAFSRQLSLFFKRYINEILRWEYNEGKLSVAVVYSGGDDVFLVGAWDHVVEAASRIRESFREFSSGAVSLSAGIGFFDDHYPIRLAAKFCEDLESEAKHSPAKNAIALFQAGRGHCYPWDTYLGSVQNKLKLLSDFFDRQDNQRGMAFLYRLLMFLRDANDPGQADNGNNVQTKGKKENKIALARYAYLLARLVPRGQGNELNDKFSQSMFTWALNPVERNELITAMYIYVYRNRGKE